jgi:hypothetical protein
MKKHVLLMMMSIVALGVSAFTPNTKWPYLMENFQEGTLYRGKDYSVAQFNVHFMGNVLHYINPKDDKIYEARHNDMDSVVIAGRKFVLADDMVMEVLGECGADKVLRYDYADFSNLTQATGAYGASANSSATRQLTSLDLAGMNNPQHGLMLQEKNDGKQFYVRTKFYLQIGNAVVEANKKEVEKILPADKKDAWKQFLKKNKIRI